MIGGISMTQAGRELSRFVEVEPLDQFAKRVFAYFESRGLQMTEVSSPKPQIFPFNSPDLVDLYDRLKS